MAKPSTSRKRPFTRASPPPRSSSRRLLISDLLRHLLPQKAKIMHRRNHSQANRATGGKQQRTFVTVIALHLQKLLDRSMSQIARGENVRERNTHFFESFPAFRQVRFNKCSMLAGQ